MKRITFAVSSIALLLALTGAGCASVSPTPLKTIPTVPKEAQSLPAPVPSPEHANIPAPQAIQPSSTQ